MHIYRHTDAQKQKHLRRSTLFKQFFVEQESFLPFYSLEYKYTTDADCEYSHAEYLLNYSNYNSYVELMDEK